MAITRAAARQAGASAPPPPPPPKRPLDGGDTPPSKRPRLDGSSSPSSPLSSPPSNLNSPSPLAAGPSGRPMLPPLRSSLPPSGGPSFPGGTGSPTAGPSGPLGALSARPLRPNLPPLITQGLGGPGQSPVYMGRLNSPGPSGGFSSGAGSVPPGGSGPISSPTSSQLFSSTPSLQSGSGSMASSGRRTPTPMYQENFPGIQGDTQMLSPSQLRQMQSRTPTPMTPQAPPADAQYPQQWHAPIPLSRTPTPTSESIGTGSPPLSP